MKKFWLGSDTTHTATAPYKPLSNGTTKHTSRATLGEVRTMLSEARKDKRIWQELAHHAVYLQNMVFCGQGNIRLE